MTDIYEPAIQHSSTESNQKPAAHSFRPHDYVIQAFCQVDLNNENTDRIQNAVLNTYKCALCDRCLIHICLQYQYT